jgi:hypothetical protein
MAAARSLAQFQKAFADEASCAAFMFDRRWPDGFVCPACGKGRFAALKSRPRLYESSTAAVRLQSPPARRCIDQNYL